MVELPRKSAFFSVSLGHFTNDTFMSMGVVMLTFLSAHLIPMSNTQIGFAVSAQQLTGAISQPFFGLRADKTGGRSLGARGVAWVVGMFMLTILLALVTRSYVLLLIPFVLQGFGSGAFHPVGSLHAAEADRTRTATNMSYFFLAGQMGLAFGPALIGLLLDVTNTDAMTPFVTPLGLPDMLAFRTQWLPVFLLTFAALPGIFLMSFYIPVRAAVLASDEKAKNSAFDWRTLPFKAMAIMGIMVTIRGLAQPGSVNFIPALFQEKGWTPAEYGLLTSSFWLAMGISGVVFGYLADQYDRRWIVFITMVLSAPAFFLLPVTDGVLAFVLTLAAGGLSGATHSLIVVLAQEMMPHGKGFASGAILGFIFATGAVGSLIIGSVSDQIGLGPTFQLVAVAAVISGVLGLLLPKSQRA
jgi:MFS transporter, FSR family, fosmidomycin resistance protein